jgi:hypothetical protein
MQRAWGLLILLTAVANAALAGAASARDWRHYRRSESGRYFAQEHVERRHRRVREDRERIARVRATAAGGLA